MLSLNSTKKQLGTVSCSFFSLMSAFSTVASNFRVLQICHLCGLMKGRKVASSLGFETVIVFKICAY